MDTRPLFPSPLSIPFAISVAGCFIFWMAAYVLIIRRALQDRTFGMPLAAMCANIVWELLFSLVYKPDYRLVEYGSAAWVLLDLGILYTAWRFAPDDFTNPIAKGWVRPMIVAGILLTILVWVPIVRTYPDPQGYFLGWADALMMSILFIALFLRRDNLRGQSIWIAIAMVMGNISAYFWVRYYPRTVLDPQVNLSFMLATVSINLLYVYLLWARYKAEGISLWTLSPIKTATGPGSRPPAELG